MKRILIHFLSRIGVYKSFSISFLLFIFVFVFVQKAHASKSQHLVIKTLQGENFDLSKMKGKVVIINFWAYWCSNCVKEMEILETIYQKYHNQGVEIIGISVDKKSQLKKILTRTKTVSYQNAILSDAVINDFVEPSAIPQNYIFDRNLNIVSNVDYDFLNKDVLSKFIELQLK